MGKVLFWGLVLWFGFGGTHLRARGYVHPLALARPDPKSWEYLSKSDTTAITLASGKKLFLAGRYDVRSTLWSDYSLAYRDRHWMVLNVGQKYGRCFHVHKFGAVSRWTGSAMSVDAGTYFAWLDIEKQLTAIDVASGEKRTLTGLPTRTYSLKGDKTLDPRPIWRDGGVIHDAERNRVVFLIYETHNEYLPFWQRRANRGGYQIVEVNLDDGSMNAISGPQKLQGGTLSWDLSLKRGEVFVVAYTGHQKDESQKKYVLEVRSLDARLLRTLPLPEKGVQGIWLSPDETRLLIERRDGGLSIVDLETSETVEGPSRGDVAGGDSAAWSPSGDTIAYLDRWELWLYDVAEKKKERIAYREPVGFISASGKYGAYWNQRPTWSPDGTMIAVNIGGGDCEETGLFDAPTLIIDLKRRLAMILPKYVRCISWIPHPRAFAGGSGDFLKGQPSLAWKFHSGETLHYQIGNTTRIDMGKNQLNHHMTLDTTWNVGEVEYGIAEITTSIDRIQFHASGEVFSQKVEVKYDSSTGKATGTFVGSAVADLLNSVVGSSADLKVDSAGRVISHRWPEKWGTLFYTQATGEVAGFYGRHIMAEPGFRHALLLPLVAVPSTAVPVGQTWNHHSISEMSDGCTELSRCSKYSYEGEREREGSAVAALKLTIGQSLTLHASDGKFRKMPFGQYQGEAYFDHVNGRLVQATISAKPRADWPVPRRLPPSPHEYQITLRKEPNKSIRQNGTENRKETSTEHPQSCLSMPEDAPVVHR
jgi:hypothetical protein